MAEKKKNKKQAPKLYYWADYGVVAKDLKSAKRKARKNK